MKLKEFLLGVSGLILSACGRYGLSIGELPENVSYIRYSHRSVSARGVISKGEMPYFKLDKFLNENNKGWKYSIVSYVNPPTRIFWDDVNISVYSDIIVVDLHRKAESVSLMKKARLDIWGEN